MSAYGRCTVQSAVLKGVEAIPVDVEVAVTRGIPGFSIVGMPDAAVQEARERVRVALKAAGYEMPSERILVNLAPSALRKNGSGFDLPIAIGLLIATGQANPDLARTTLYVGELSLDGFVRQVPGILAYALCARDMGYSLGCSTDATGFVAIEGLDAKGLAKLENLRLGQFEPVSQIPLDAVDGGLDYCEVSGNEIAKRAFQIAAAGRHGLLMMGPPGSGKTMLASRMPSILPPLTEDEMLETALIHSVAGESVAAILAGQRPFRSPHHSATGPGLIGGGSPIRPGEISLAHNGVLFLDELPEFRTSVLQQMRQPLESGRVCISRADGNIAFPSNFMLVAASNPCPCGYFGDPSHQCKCTLGQIRAYQNRIGGPLLDRIDLHLDVWRVAPQEVIEAKQGTASHTLRDGVLVAREYASWRKSQEGGGTSTKAVIASCRLSGDDERFFEQAARFNNMSGRAIVRTLCVARTIADIAQRRNVNRNDLSEALGFRIREGENC